MSRDIEEELRTYFAARARSVPDDGPSPPWPSQLVDDGLVELAVLPRHDSRRPARLLPSLAAASLVVVLLGAGFWLSRPGSPPSLSSSGAAEARWVPGSLPAEFRVDGTSDVTYQVLPLQAAAVYRDVSAPLGSPALLVLLREGTATADGAAVRLGSVEAVESESNGATVISWQAVPDRVVEVWGRGIESSAVWAFAQSVHVTSDDQVEASTVPAGFSKVSIAPQHVPLVAASVTYRRADDAIVAVTARSADPTELEIYAVVTGGLYRPITVQGHVAHEVTGPQTGYRRVVWSTGGSLLDVSTTGLSADEVLSVASHARPATAAEWDALLVESGQSAEVVTSLPPPDHACLPGVDMDTACGG